MGKMDVDNFGSWLSFFGNGTGNLTAAASIQLKNQTSTVLVDPWEENHSTEVTRLENVYFIQEQTYRDFTTAAQILILIGSLLANAAVLWCTCYTNVFKSATGRFIQNLACAGICATLVCVPYDVALGGGGGASPRCCAWLRAVFFCKAIKFLHKVFCSATVLSFAAIALDRYYSVLYPLERKISDTKSRDLVIYIWVHATVASVPVLVVTNVTDIYATSSCSAGPPGSPGPPGPGPGPGPAPGVAGPGPGMADGAGGPGPSLGHLVYVVVYNVTTVILPLAAVFLAMVLIRRALSASQKKKVIIAALRTPQNCISIPYVSQREAELHATLLAAVLLFTLCSAPYAVLVVYQLIAPAGSLGGSPGLTPVTSAAPPLVLWLTAAWVPKLSLLTNPLLFLTVNRSARHCLVDLLARAHRRCSRRNAVGSAGLGDGDGADGGGVGGAGGGGGGGMGGEAAARSGSQLLEMFNIGQQQIFSQREEDEEEEEEEEVEEEGDVRQEIPSVCSVGSHHHHRVQELTVVAGSARTVGSVSRSESSQHSHHQHHQPHQHTAQGGTRESGLPLPKSSSPSLACTHSSQVAPATPTDPEEASSQFGFGPFELPPQWLPETRHSKRRLLPPLGNTPEELIQTKQPRPRTERRISRNNKVSTFPPTVDP
ncbi:G-protein coupled receptor 176 [Engraulis encrasicolus]|uniref:G-protein coupled receptor 176 n=1 Tax=Engraulis encrasicolus TaxID=184585 RepID=UPI002FD710B3